VCEEGVIMAENDFDPQVRKKLYRISTELDLFATMQDANFYMQVDDLLEAADSRSPEYSKGYKRGLYDVSTMLFEKNREYNNMAAEKY
jgi:predicted transcriptional regulator